MKKLIITLSMLLALGGIVGCSTAKGIVPEQPVVQTHEDLFAYVQGIVKDCKIIGQRMLDPVHLEVFAKLGNNCIDFLVHMPSDQVLGMVIRHADQKWEVILMSDGKYERLSDDEALAFVTGRKFDMIFNKVFGTNV